MPEGSKPLWAFSAYSFGSGQHFAIGSKFGEKKWLPKLARSFGQLERPFRQ